MIQHELSDAPLPNRLHLKTCDPGATVDAMTVAMMKGPALIVEDDAIIALEAESLLKQLGAAEVRLASTVAAALAAIEKYDFAYAMLDVNLGDENVLAVARTLAAKGVPFIFTTGYGENTLVEQGYPDAPLVLKPYGAASLAKALNSL